MIGGSVTGLAVTANPLLTPPPSRPPWLLRPGFGLIGGRQLHRRGVNAGTGDTDTVTIDTLDPTVDVDIVDTALNDGDNSSVVTFTFSEAVIPGSVALNVLGGSLSALSWALGNASATATFTAAQDSVTPGWFRWSVHRGGRQRRHRRHRHGDDRHPNPTVDVDIVDTARNDGDNSSVVTFTFSEAVIPGSVALNVLGGSLSALTWAPGNASATATFTAAQDSVTPGSVQVVSYTDVAGNAGTGDTDTVTIDTRNPTVDVDIVDTALNDGDNSSVVTFTFSEAVIPGSVALDVLGGSRRR